MSEFGSYGDVSVELSDDYVATAEIQRPPHNYFDVDLIGCLADAFEALAADPRCRAIVLCSQGKNFCAGAQLAGGGDAQLERKSSSGEPAPHLYDEGVRLFATKTPVVAAIQGAAVGGGLGLALMPDFRVAAPEARFTANFARLGFHHGFGLSVTLPALVGQQKALELLYTGSRLNGEEALAIGLCDQLVPLEELSAHAHALAADIATSAPLAIQSIRETMRGDLPDRIRRATDREQQEQDRLRRTNDFKEGVRAMGERRKPDFTGS